ncbi:hypothetical protein [Candidatus Anaplasma sp. TIGMIC]|nr:hypothetical protein [Candidatus Anaplasma sp. TIGMIC]MDB1135131.1 hypothetical protein [Candidatus Anaplasma sp. TIGMIC]
MVRLDNEAAKAAFMPLTREWRCSVTSGLAALKIISNISRNDAICRDL